MKLEPGNIWSGNRKLAVLTNPTELAHRKGNLKRHYPITYKQKAYADSEAAYQAATRMHKHDLYFLKATMIDILVVKLQQYTAVFSAIVESGGELFLEKCSHVVTNKGRWEGHGRNSLFIDCLIKAFDIVDEEWDDHMQFEVSSAYHEIMLFCPKCNKEVNIDISEKPFKNGKGSHIRADCTECKGYIKFLSKT